MAQNVKKVYNLQKHTSYVFASTIHTVVCYWDLNKYKSSEYGKNLTESQNLQWNEYKKKDIEEEEYIATGGADKCIYLWKTETIDKQDSYKEAKLVEQFKENKGQDNLQEQKELQFTQDELNFGHYVVQPQQNLYEFITCLISVKIDQNSYLIAGYESNQIIRYEIKGEFWRTQAHSKKHQIMGSEQYQLQSHNDSVRSLLYCQGELYSCSDDLTLMIQDIRGYVKRMFYFDGIIDNLFQINLNQRYQILFMYQTTDSQKDIKEVIEKRIQNQILATGQLQQENQREIEVQVQRQIYKFKIVQNIMLLNTNVEDSQFNLRMSIQNQNEFQEDLQQALIQVEEITSTLIKNNHLFVSTINGKIIKYSLDNREAKKQVQEKYKCLEGMQYVDKSYTYNLQQNINPVQIFNFQVQIISMIPIGEEYYVMCKRNQNPCLMKLNTQWNETQTQNLEIFYTLNVQPTEYDDHKRQGPQFEVFLQNPLYLPMKNMIVYCGDQLRYIKL